MIYFDNAATTYPKPECVYTEMDRVSRTLAYNAGRGSYKGASSAQKLIHDLKDKIRKFVHVKGYECFLTPSATIALNEIIGGIEWKKKDKVFITPYEHNAVVRPLYHMREAYGFDICEMPLDKDLGIDLAKLKYIFSVAYLRYYDTCQQCYRICGGCAKNSGGGKKVWGNNSP